MDPTQLASSLFAYATPVGLGLLLATAVARLLRQGVGAVLVASGIAASISLAALGWPFDVLPLTAILLLAAGAIGLGVWSLRRPAPLLELAVITAAWYLVLRGAMGAAFLATIAGPLAWAAAVFLTMIATEPRGRREEARVPVEAEDETEPPAAVAASWVRTGPFPAPPGAPLFK